jgi:hypothetical protein
VALMTLQQISEPSLTPAYSAPTASDTITPASPGLFLHVKNTNAGADVVTVVVPGTGPGGVATPDFTVNVPATTGDRMIPMVNPAYVDPATGLITVQHSNVAAGVVAALVRA